jgi:hypothetical protein
VPSPAPSNRHPASKFGRWQRCGLGMGPTAAARPSCRPDPVSRDNCEAHDNALTERTPPRLLAERLQVVRSLHPRQQMTAIRFRHSALWRCVGTITIIVSGVMTMVNDHTRLPVAGHAPGHLRNEFLEALEAHYKNRTDSKIRERLAAACALLWNCTDILPGSDAAMVADLVSGERRGYSYAAAARQIRSYLT